MDAGVLRQGQGETRLPKIKRSSCTSRASREILGTCAVDESCRREGELVSRAPNGALLVGRQVARGRFELRAW
jgi:hypothetical protein